ncbi:MAG TPA: helix-turn-helix domain-containing protein [Acidimicrobiales bacterium]|jgi:AcrR family transcriptional regulator
MAVSPEPDNTKERILDVALRLFSENGIYQVPISQIREAAGQRNASAVQYHFGNRDGLIRAIVDRHIDAIHFRRVDLLEATSTADEPTAVALALFAPLAEMLDGDWRDLAYLRFIGELLTRPEFRFEDITALVGHEHADVANEAIERILSHGSPLPKTLRDERIRAAAIMVMHSLAEQATLRAGGIGRRPLPTAIVLANLVDMYVAALLAPVSPAAVGGNVTSGRRTRSRR